MKLSTRELVLAAFFTALMCAVTILVRAIEPIVVIPFSLQPLIVMVAASILSPRGAFLSMLSYLLLGLIGIPVFSQPPFGGPAYVLIPSFGFILAYPVAAWMQSLCIKRNRFLDYFLSALLAIVVIYLIGLPYIYAVLHFYLGKTVDIVDILKIGFIPFILFDLIKAVLASVLAVEICRRLEIGRGQV